MRIRKHASKLLGVALGSHSTPATEAPLIGPRDTAGAWQLCQLNRSPWDVMPSPPPSPNLYLRCDLQAAVEDEAIQIKEERNQSQEEGAPAIDIVKDNKDEKKEVILCKKTDGKKWKCKRFVLNHHSFCDYHLNQLRSHNKNSKQIANNVNIPAAPVKNTGKKVLKATSAGTTGEVADGSSFYYYAGFGPCSRSKRRGGSCRDETRDIGVNSELAEDYSKQINSSLIINNGDLVHENLSEDERAKKTCTVKKRGRKRVKARSLKSLL